MFETEYRLDETAFGTIGVDGTATTIGIGPKAANERWVIDYMSATGPNTAQLQIFRGNDRNRQIDVTVSADNDTSDTIIDLRSGDTISLVWSRGTTGAIMSLHLEGKRLVKGQRSY